MATRNRDGDAAGRTVEDLVFAGFNRRVVALDRYTGEIVWEWKAPHGTSYTTLLLDGDRLVVGVNGYLYCLDPLFGQVVWENPMKGFGTGATTLASTRGSAPNLPAAAAEDAARAAAAAAGAG